ncbi:hypothetical protein L873DRAFT_1237823 [Choiromyces venosus 120613-1]|uniref:Uncharacterized protein n=1 Tax=Choiromyces venosus 120613-1 TaxID=1336337 RepID=A0A3N4JDM0_9PEZI|nr:hypothetical protein L873DRAFT_1237823 [Choiromyces venosus 120613-1]
MCDLARPRRIFHRGSKLLLVFNRHVSEVINHPREYIDRIVSHPVLFLFLLLPYRFPLFSCWSFTSLTFTSSPALLPIPKASSTLRGCSEYSASIFSTSSSDVPVIGYRLPSEKCKRAR